MTEKICSRRFGLDDENGQWIIIDKTYRFNEDGTFVCDRKTSAFGLRSDCCDEGTWSYRQGLLTIRFKLSTVSKPSRYNVLWYGNDVFELRNGFSLEESRETLEESFQATARMFHIPGRLPKVYSYGGCYSDFGVETTWSDSSWIGVFGTVSLPVIARRCADAPAPPTLASVRLSPPPELNASAPAPVRQSPRTIEPKRNTTTQCEKWSLKERSHLEEYKVRFVYELSDNASVEEADRVLNPQLQAELQKAFMQSNPDVDPESVHATANCEMRSGPPRTLVYTVSSFTSQPVLFKKEYNAKTCKGYVSVRTHTHGDTEAALEFARKEIEMIALHENVMLEVGKEPPPGAKYTWRDVLSDGNIHTVHFQLHE